MKKYLALVIAAAWAGAATVWADSEVQSEVVDGVTWSYSIANGEATVTRGTTPCVGEMIIPDTLGGCPVTAIGGDAFYGNKEISKMTLPATVKSIGSCAFQTCSALASINFPEGLMTIGSDAFNKCSALTTVSLPDTVTSLGSWSFYSCTAMKTIKLSSGLTSIPKVAFNDCSALMKIVLPSSVTSIGSQAFGGCSSVTTLTLPEGVATIGSQAFYECRALKALKIPSTVMSVAESAFQSTSALKTIDVESGCTCVKVVDGCLVSAAGNTLLAVPSGNEHVTIPEGIVSIPSEMFYRATNLKTITLPSTLLTMGASAFYYCSALSAIEFPVGFASFSGSSHFGYCSSLKHVIFNGVPPANIGNSRLLDGEWYACPNVSLAYPREYGADWQKVVELSKFNGYKRTNKPEVEYVAVAVRANDPTILDVVYKVTSSVTNTVKVRVLAFEEGVRSFANVVRPTTFVADTNGVETAGNVGDAVAANVEHTLSWKVSADWSNQLAKVTFEVLATEGDLLPLEVRTIPASDQYGKMDVSWNAITENQWFDALLWLYADKNPKVVLSNGIYYYDGKVAAKDATIYYNKTASSYYSRTYDSDARQYVYVRYKNAPEVVLEEMGYTLLSGEVLNYVNEETRLGLSPSGVRQYGYRIVDE